MNVKWFDWFTSRSSRNAGRLSEHCRVQWRRCRWRIVWCELGRLWSTSHWRLLVR